MTDYSKLVKARRIKAGKFSKSQARDRLDLAQRDIFAAKKMVANSYDWGFNIAYNAMLQAARALMLSKGYRAIGGDQHVTVIDFAKTALPAEFTNTLSFMNRMRRKRHKTVYDTAGLVSSKEAANAVETAENFLKTISKLII